MNWQRVLIVGADGILGSHLAASLRREGVYVLAFAGMGRPVAFDAPLVSASLCNAAHLPGLDVLTCVSATFNIGLVASPLLCLCRIVLGSASFLTSCYITSTLSKLAESDFRRASISFPARVLTQQSTRLRYHDKRTWTSRIAMMEAAGVDVSYEDPCAPDSLAKAFAMANPTHVVSFGVLQDVTDQYVEDQPRDFATVNLGCLVNLLEALANHSRRLERPSQDAQDTSPGPTRFVMSSTWEVNLHAAEMLLSVHTTHYRCNDKHGH